MPSNGSTDGFLVFGYVPPPRGAAPSTGFDPNNGIVLGAVSDVGLFDDARAGLAAASAFGVVSNERVGLRTVHALGVPQAVKAGVRSLDQFGPASLVPARLRAHNTPGFLLREGAGVGVTHTAQGLFDQGAQSVVSVTGDWLNETNALGDTPGTFAQIDARSAGLLNTTETTATGILTLDFSGFVTTGFDTLVEAKLTHLFHVRTNGVGAGGSWDVRFEHEMGAGWQSDLTLSSVGTLTTAEVDLTGELAGNPAALASLQVRADGTMESGTGFLLTPSVRNFLWYSTILSLTMEISA